MRQRLAITLVLLLVTLMGAVGPILPAQSQVTATWSSPQRLTRTTDFDFKPSIIQTLDGKVWAFWENAINVFPGPLPIPDIHYKTWDWSTWASLNGNLSAGGSPEQTLVANPAQDISPAAAQLNNGTLFVSFASNRTGNYEIFLKRYNPSTGWSAETQITSDSARDEVSSLLAASDGSLWLFWDRTNPTTGTRNIYYKKYVSGTGWSSETAFTTDTYPVLDRQPAAYQTRDGRIWLVWSQVQDQTFGKVYLYYKTFSGAAWSSAVQLTQDSNPDFRPSILQDTDNIIWVFWSRELPVGGTCYQQDLFYKTSANNGVTWSAEGQLTDDRQASSCPDDNTPDDGAPSAAEFKDYKIYVLWESDRDAEGWWDIHYAYSSKIPGHDAAVTSVTTPSLAVRKNTPVTVTVRVANLGNYSETFTLTVTATNTTTITIATQTITLAAGASQTLTYTWFTLTVNPARYKITASIPPLASEDRLHLDNNNLTGPTLHLVPPGDVNYDGKVDLIDAASVSYSYGTVPGNPLWNANADLNFDNHIDIFDATIIGIWFGTTG